MTTVRRSAIIEKEMRTNLAEDPHLEENDFSLVQFWLRRSKPSTCAETGEVEVGLPYLVLIARLYNGIESTSCQAERNFSALSFLIGSLRSSISPGKVERLICSFGSTGSSSRRSKRSPRRHRSQQSSGSSVQRESCASGGGNGEHGSCLEPMNL